MGVELLKSMMPSDSAESSGSENSTEPATDTLAGGDMGPTDYGDQTADGTQGAAGTEAGYDTEAPNGTEPSLYADQTAYGTQTAPAGDQGAYGVPEASGDQAAYGTEAAYNDQTALGPDTAYGEQMADGYVTSYGGQPSYGNQALYGNEAVSYGDPASYNDPASYGDQASYGTEVILGNQMTYGTEALSGQQMTDSNVSSRGDQASSGINAAYTNLDAYVEHADSPAPGQFITPGHYNSQFASTHKMDADGQFATPSLGMQSLNAQSAPQMASSRVEAAVPQQNPIQIAADALAKALSQVTALSEQTSGIG